LPFDFAQLGGDVVGLLRADIDNGEILRVLELDFVLYDIDS
jgi:hypothetical protein